MEDGKLLGFAKKPEVDKKKQNERHPTESIKDFEEESLLCSRLKLVNGSIVALEKDLSQEEDYPLLQELIKSIEKALGKLTKCNPEQVDKSEVEKTAHIA